MAAFESKKYAWRSGYSYRVPANTVGSVLEKIEKEQGTVTKEAFLEYSRDESSETHELFEWNDSTAAEKYRLIQAGKVITQLEVSYEYVKPDNVELSVVVEEAQHTPVTYSAYVNVQKRATGIAASYMNTEKAMGEEKTRKQVLENAMQELRVFKRKYEQCKELAVIFEAIERLEETC